MPERSEHGQATTQRACQDRPVPMVSCSRKRASSLCLAPMLLGAAACAPPPAAAPPRATGVAATVQQTPAITAPGRAKGCRSLPRLPAGAGSVWAALTQQAGCWELARWPHGTDDPRDVLFVQVDYVEKVLDASVARIRGAHGDLNTSPSFLVAVNDRGAWFFGLKTDDRRIARELASPPTFVVAPAPDEPSKATEWRFLRYENTDEGPVLCKGYEAPRSAGRCGDDCRSRICFSATAGVVLVEGREGPGSGTYVQKGFSSLVR